MYQPRASSIDYLEMPSQDLALTRAFFASLFGWKFEDYGPDYIAFDDGRIAGGFFRAAGSWADAAACPLVVFYSEELEMTRADVVRLGGVVTRDIFLFPGGRRFHFAAPGTGGFALWSDK